MVLQTQQQNLTVSYIFHIQGGNKMPSPLCFFRTYIQSDFQ